MRSSKIRVGDTVNYTKNTEFGPGKVVKIIQKRVPVRNHIETIWTVYAVELPEPFSEGDNGEWFPTWKDDIVVGDKGREKGCIWTTEEFLEQLSDLNDDMSDWG